MMDTPLREWIDILDRGIKRQRDGGFGWKSKKEKGQDVFIHLYSKKDKVIKSPERSTNDAGHWLSQQ